MTTLSAKRTGHAIELNRWRNLTHKESRNSLTSFVLPRLEAIKERLSFIRDYPSFLFAIVITLVAVFLFIATYFVSKNLKTQINAESILLARQLNSLSASAISADQLIAERERLRAREQDVDKIKLLALQSTQRELLSYDVFPQPDPNVGFSASVFHLFGQRFRRGIDTLVARVNGGDCPTEVEVNRILENSLLRTGRSRFASLDLSRNPGRNGYGSYMSRIERAIIDEICKERAKSLSVYVDPADVSGYDYWAKYEYQGKEEAIKDCWYHQQAYWVIEDLFDTIEAMNYAHENVLTAPVKRLQDVTFTIDLRRPGTGGRVFTGFRSLSQKKNSGVDRPAYVCSANEGLTESCTGRFCNGDYDVIHFSTSFLVNQEAVLPLMNELCSGKEHTFSGFSGQEAKRRFKHNQIAILESTISPIDRNDPGHRFYRYGPDRVVELRLVCEYIFYKKGYENIKPEAVKNELQKT